MSSLYQLGQPFSLLGYNAEEPHTTQIVLLSLHDFSWGDSEPFVVGVFGIVGIFVSQNFPRISAHLSLFIEDSQVREN